MEKPGIDGFLKWCISELDPTDVMLDPELIVGYCLDWTGRLTGQSRAILRPDTPQKVRSIIRSASSFGIKLCIQGGNTSLSGGSVPLLGEVVLSTKRLTKIRSISPESAVAVVEAGVTLAELQRVAAGFGFGFGVDIAPRDSATLGGMAATNAGGLHVLRYGSMRSQVIGVEVAYGDGSELAELSELIKDNVGFSEPAIVVGSEGTLGVITALAVRLTRLEPSRAVALLPVESASRAKALAGEVRRLLGSVSAIELFDSTALALVEQDRGLKFPIQPLPAFVVLVECTSDRDAEDDLVRLLSSIDGAYDTSAAMLSSDSSLVKAMWGWREGIPSAIRRVGEALKLDLAVPVRLIDELYDRTTEIANQYGDALLMVRFGHLGDGNLHVNLLGEDEVVYEASERVYGVVAELGGAITAEHGVGVLKKQFVGLVRSDATILRYGRLIEIYNPDRVTNPNVMV